MLSSSRGQGNFRGIEASRPRPRSSKCVLEDVLEAKDVLEDSTSANYNYKITITKMHFRGTRPVTFFWGTILAWGANFSLEGAQAVIWGAMPRNAPRWHLAWPLSPRNILTKACKSSIPKKLIATETHDSDHPFRVQAQTKVKQPSTGRTKGKEALITGTNSGRLLFKL